MTLLFDADSGTTLAMSPTELYVVDTEEMARLTNNPEFADDLDFEDEEAQSAVQNFCPSLAEITPTLAHETQVMRAADLVAGDILVDGDAWMTVTENLGESDALDEYQNIATPFGTLSIYRGRNLRVIRGA